MDKNIIERDKNIIERDIRDTKSILNFVNNLQEFNNLDYVSGNIKENNFVIINKYLKKVYDIEEKYYHKLQEELKQHE